MLTEFAFTPSVFDESVHGDRGAWREQLRELGANLFPRTAAWPVMVADLHGGSWRQRVVSIVSAIKDSTARVLCENLLKNVTETLINRPVHGKTTPGTDAIAWGKEAVGSHSQEPIDRIITCKAAHAALAHMCPAIRSIEDVSTDSFWSDVTSAWSQTMRIADQISALRKLCVHARFVCLITPHIYGGSDDESDFAVALIRSAFRRPPNYSAVEIEIHTEGPDRPAMSDYAVRLANRTRSVSGYLRKGLAPGQAIELLVWPKLLDRYILAGDYTKMSDGTLARRIRWGVSMPHIARKLDEREPKPPTPWTLLTRPQLLDQFNRYCVRSTPGSPAPAQIVG